MSVFIDTGVLYAHHETDAARHDDACSFFDMVLNGELGQPYTNDYVFDEAVTLTQRRTGESSTARLLADRILGNEPFPDVIELEFIESTVFESGIDIFETYADHSLSFTDAVSVAHCRARSIDCIASFDDDFDGVYDRFDPRSITA